MCISTITLEGEIKLQYEITHEDCINENLKENPY